jgi:hypothetical protein
MRVQPTKVRKIANKLMASYHTLNPGISWLPGHKKKTNCYSNWAFCISCYFQITAFSELLSSLFDGQIGQWVWPNWPWHYPWSIEFGDDDFYLSKMVMSYVKSPDGTLW